jgi:hypothetical protein
MKARGKVEYTHVGHVDCSCANGGRYLDAIPGETDEDNREIAGAPEIFELQKDVSKGIQSGSVTP